ncbi:MAG: carboxypeptidase regulatory-like domain-containing protein, partial [Deltaproteobacteria bacterium]|nr:carboxypeptidase regulatory-like domain-containing protein [Deltaproteobacteria bacterium]
RYEFASLPTLAGFNEFRLVFYGPQGQTRERVESYYVTPGFAEPGQSSFRLAFNQRNRDFIDIDDTTRNQPDDGENRLVFQAEHGLNETTSIGAGLASLSVDGERFHYGSVNLQGSILGALSQFDAALSDDGGLALGGRLQARVGDWSVFGEQNFYEGFHSEQTDNASVSGHLSSLTSLRVNGHLPDLGFGRQPLSASLTHEVSEQGDWQTTAFGRISALVRPFNFALSSTTRLRSESDAESDARLLVGTLLGDFRLRGEIGVDVVPVLAFDQATLSADWRIARDFGARFGLRHYGGERELTSATVGLNYQFEHFAVGLNIDGDSEGEYNARFGLSFSFGRDPGSDSIAVRARPFARYGAVSAQAFLDSDNDGVFDADERPIEGAGFSGPRLPREARTDAGGSSFITGLEPYRATEIGLDEATLEDPFWTSARPPLQVVTRPGSATTLLFPVIETGEVDGTVLVGATEGGALRPGGGLRVYLRDAAGRVVAETETAYDGYYFFDRIPYGRYQLVLDPQQLEALGYAPVPPRSISLGVEEPFVIGQDFLAPPDPLVTAAGDGTVDSGDLARPVVPIP